MLVECCRRQGPARCEQIDAADGEVGRRLRFVRVICLGCKVGSATRFDASGLIGDSTMAKADGDAKNTLYCSFCGKSQHEVRKLIAGPTVFVCDECVELCMDIIREENKSSLTKSQDLSLIHI